MALPPGYLILFEAAAQLDFANVTREDAIQIETWMRDQGWVIVPSWLVMDPPVGVVVEE
jgi:hypothetical protein